MPLGCVFIYLSDILKHMESFFSVIEYRFMKHEVKEVLKYIEGEICRPSTTDRDRHFVFHILIPQ